MVKHKGDVAEATPPLQKQGCFLITVLLYADQGILSTSFCKNSKDVVTS